MAPAGAFFIHMILTAKPISLQDFYDISLNREALSLDKKVIKNIVQTRKAIDTSVENKEIIYGVTTGFGAFKNTAISTKDVKKLQENLILSHATGVGKPFNEEIVRGMMFLIVNYLSKGFSGVRPIVVETLVDMLNKGVYPYVPEKGSVGSSGDLAPSAHIMLVLLGKGEAFIQGKRVPGLKAMKHAKVKPISLDAKEGLALTNNTSAQTAVACLALLEAKRLADTGDIAGALSAEALRATTKAFDIRIHQLKPHKGQLTVAKRLRKLLKGSTMIDNNRVQDQYSIRCMPQIHGAVREAIDYADRIITTEINAVTDNPLIFQETNKKITVLSGGNFHGEPIAIALDALGIAICELANISDRRIASLLDPATNNGLPAFLAANGGVNSGLMILQYTTAALVSENKVLAHPASVDSIPTSANVEDLVSMGTIAARKAYEIAQNVKSVLAIELLVAAQAIDFRMKEKYKLGRLTREIYQDIRANVPSFPQDEVYYPYITILSQLIDTYLPSKRI